MTSVGLKWPPSGRPSSRRRRGWQPVHAAVGVDHAVPRCRRHPRRARGMAHVEEIGGRCRGRSSTSLSNVSIPTPDRRHARARASVAAIGTSTRRRASRRAAGAGRSGRGRWASSVTRLSGSGSCSIWSTTISSARRVRPSRLRTPRASSCGLAREHRGDVTSGRRRGPVGDAAPRATAGHWRSRATCCTSVARWAWRLWLSR